MNTLSIAGYYKENGENKSGNGQIQDVVNEKSYEIQIRNGYYERTIKDPEIGALFKVSYLNCEALIRYTNAKIKTIVKNINYQTENNIQWESTTTKINDLWYKIENDGTADGMIVVIRVAEIGDGIADAVVLIEKVHNNIEIKFNYSGMYEIKTYGVDNQDIILGEKTHNIHIPNGEIKIVKEIIKNKYVSIETNKLGDVINPVLSADIKLHYKIDADAKVKQMNGNATVKTNSGNGEIKNV